MQDVIENISQKAMADNGALREGDSPDASRYEAPRLRFAAQQLLQMCYAGQGGYGARPESELLQMMAIPIRVREDMVNRIANYRQGAYTAQQFVDWYKSEPLSDEAFEWALVPWNKSFL